MKGNLYNTADKRCQVVQSEESGQGKRKRGEIEGKRKEMVGKNGGREKWKDV